VRHWHGHEFGIPLVACHLRPLRGDGDAFISHLAVAIKAGPLKVGSFSRSERMVKWNEVIRIERHLAGEARFIGGAIFQRILQR